MMDYSFLNEAFKKLDILDEDVFDADKEGAEDYKAFMDDESNSEEVITVADVDADDDEALKDNYIGNVILDCTICHSKLFKSPEDVEVTEDGELANIDEECPYCTSTEGYRIIGQIEPFSNTEDGEDTVGTEDGENVEEGLLIPDANINIDAHDFGGTGNNVSVLSPGKMLGEKKCKEALLSPDLNLNIDAHNFGGNNNDVSVLGGGITEEDDDCKDMSCKKHLHLKNAVKESFDSVEIVKDGEKISIASEPADSSEDDIDDSANTEVSDDEVIEPVDDETKEEIMASEESPEEEDVDIDEVSEDELDNLGESYLKSVYENVKSYKTNKATIIGNKLKLEGIITFKSGNRKNTAFLFESKEITRRGKLKFIGENCQITKNKKAFTLTGRMNSNKFIAESLNYNYYGRDGKKSVRVYGTKRVK